MSLFSSKTYYFAHAGSQSLFEVQPDTLESNILQTAIGNEGTMSQAIRYVIATDQFARAKAMMRYAERYYDPTKPGGYVRGFPEANLNLVTVAPEQIEAALTRAVGTWDQILFMKAGDYDEVFMVEKEFQDMWPDAFLAQYNLLNGPPPEEIWHSGLSEITIPVVNPDTGEYYLANNDIDIIRVDPEWDFGEEPFGPTPVFLGYYRVSFPYTDNNGDPQLFSFQNQVNITEYLSGSWIQVRYLQDGIEKYWTYKVGSGLDPDLETYIQEEEREASFLPVAVLMHDRVWFNEDPDSELAITTNKLLKKMGTTGDQVREDFEAAEEENPSEGGDKWDFFMHFAIPIETKVRGSLEYFWYFFSELEAWESFKAEQYLNYLASPNSAQPINEINITEAGVTGYNVDYRWSYIHTTSHTGFWEVENTDEDKYGPGPTRPLRGREVAKEIIQLQQGVGTNTEYQEIIDRAFGPGTPIGTYNEDPDEGGYHDIVVLWRQRRDDELEPGDDPEVGRYDQMIIMGLSMQYRINTAEIGVDGARDNRFRYAVPLLFGDEEETKEFRIPILYKSLLEVPVLHREEAVADGFTATVFLVERQKVKWYQRSFFKWLIVIIAIVIVVLAIFYPGFYAVLKQYAAAIAAAFGSTSAFAVLAIYKLLLFALGTIIALAASTIGQEFGSTAGLIFSIIAAAAMFYAGGGFQNLSNSWNSMLESPGWASAVSFINAVSPIYNMGFSVYQNRVLAGYEDELRDFIADAKEKQQQLKDAWDSFGPVPDWIDPMDLVNMFRRLGSSESANSYLSRTLTLNPGVLGYEAIGEFTDLALMLPQELQEGTVVDAMMQDFAKQRGAV